MKKHIYLVLTFFLFVGTSAKAAQFIERDTIENVSIEDEKIIFNDNLIGKFETKELQSSDDKTKVINVLIYSTEGSLIAEYDVQLLNKEKKNTDSIVSASVKTVKDKVNHNGSNFIDFHHKKTDKPKNEILQLSKVVKYLIEYKYF